MSNRNSEKRAFFEYHAERGPVSIYINTAKHPGLSLPESLTKNESVVLNFSHKYKHPLLVDKDRGLAQLLSFPDVGDFFVLVPWERIFCVSGQTGRVDWGDDDPLFIAMTEAIPGLPNTTQTSSNPYPKGVASEDTKPVKKGALVLIQGEVGKNDPLPSPPITGHLRLVLPEPTDAASDPKPVED